MDRPAISSSLGWCSPRLIGGRKFPLFVRSASSGLPHAGSHQNDDQQQRGSHPEQENDCPKRHANILRGDIGLNEV